MVSVVLGLGFRVWPGLGEVAMALHTILALHSLQKILSHYSIKNLKFITDLK